MPDYRIEWSIDWAGDSPRQAVENMIREFPAIRFPQRADHLTVIDADGNQTAIHLYSPEEDDPMPDTPATMYRCDRCRELIEEDNLDTVKNLFERVQPGDIMPAGECPLCGGLCHAEPEPKLAHYLVISYFAEESQSIFDYVSAYSATEAERIVAEVRPDCDVVSTWTAAELAAVAADLHPDTPYPTTAAQLRAELGMEPEEEEQ